VGSIASISLAHYVAEIVANYPTIKTTFATPGTRIFRQELHLSQNLGVMQHKKLAASTDRGRREGLQ
ncbi:MAG: hypothetical protein Q7J06_01845, partial [Bacteroidales bacterium]|nr:hypothetical protein [Bacteroidales bacterium]